MCSSRIHIAEIGDSVYSRRSTRYASPPMCPTTLVVPRVKAGEGPWRRIHVKCWEEQDHACFKPCIKLALILTIGWSCSPFLIEPRLSHFKVHPIPIQLWVGPPFGSSVISTGAWQWDLNDYVTRSPRRNDYSMSFSYKYHKAKPLLFIKFLRTFKPKLSYLSTTLKLKNGNIGMEKILTNNTKPVVVRNIDIYNTHWIINTW